MLLVLPFLSRSKKQATQQIRFPRSPSQLHVLLRLGYSSSSSFPCCTFHISLVPLLTRLVGGWESLKINFLLLWLIFFASHNLSTLLLLLCGSEKPQTRTKVVFQSSRRAEKRKVSCLIFHSKLRVFHIQIKTMPNYTRDGDNLNFFFFACCFVFFRIPLNTPPSTTQHQHQQDGESATHENICETER